MITLTFACMLILSLNALMTHRENCMALVINLELLAMLNIFFWSIYLNSGDSVAALTTSFWLMLFIILGATMALVLLSVAYFIKPSSMTMFN